MRTVTTAPILLQAARALCRHHIRGGHFAVRQLQTLGMLDAIAEYDLDGTQISVPLYRIPWDHLDVRNYEADFIAAFRAAVRSLQDVQLFDCGADIGIFSAKLCSGLKNIARIIAFEPNEAVHDFLRLNLARLAVPFIVTSSALSNRCGPGRLESPDHSPADHARFLVMGSGDLKVETLDAYGVRGGNIAIKIDVEGGELAVLQGAAETIKAATACVVAVEAHPTVASRTGRDPIECLRFLDSLRPFRFTIAETGEHPSLADRIIREDQTEIWNIVCSTQGCSSASGRCS
ncbi:MAG TPA: FkbM family methyltransferase [Xanthobacteraceae bacterium]